MGFSGTFVVARSDRPIVELDGIRDLADAVLWHGRGDDGWQVVQLHGAPAGWQPPMTGDDDRERLLTGVLAQTGHPVLAGIVLASDGAQVIGHSRRAGRWSGWLSLEVLVDYLGPEWREELDRDDDEDLPDDLDTYWADRYREACRPLYALVPPAAGATPGVVAWAREAGFAPDAAAVEAVLDGGMTFAEAHFLTLVRTLGVPLPAASAEPA
jgi:hypothetical protein